MRQILLLACASVGLLTGARWGERKGTFDYQLAPDAPADVTAIIRPAENDERRAPKANVVVRIFNPGGPSRALLLGINAPSATLQKLKGYGAVRVMPGTYEVVVQCITGGWWGNFTLSVPVAAGEQRLIECTGNTAHTMAVSVFNKQ
jgi:hypothetical protein